MTLQEFMNKYFNNIIGEYGTKVWCWRGYTDGLAGATFLY